MYRRRRGCERYELVRVGSGDGDWVEGPEAIEDSPRASKRMVHRVLLVQHHADGDRERVLVQNRIRFR